MPHLVTASVDRIRLQPGTAISLDKSLGEEKVSGLSEFMFYGNEEDVGKHVIFSLWD